MYLLTATNGRGETFSGNYDGCLIAAVINQDLDWTDVRVDQERVEMTLDKFMSDLRELAK